MLAVAVLSIGLSVAVQAGPLTSGCEQCHLVLHDGPSGPHVVEWTTSEHAARRVGCVRCHNGDAASDESLEAHRFVLPSSARTSPINRRQLPATCSACHPREATLFTTSRHGALLAAGTESAPSCASCHDSMSARVPSPEALQSSCAACHLDDPGHEQFPSDARVLTEWLTSLRERMARLEPAVVHEPNDTARRMYWDAFTTAEDSLAQAVGSFHAFDLATAKSSLVRARSRIEFIEQSLPGHTN